MCRRRILDLEVKFCTQVCTQDPEDVEFGDAPGREETSGAQEGGSEELYILYVDEGMLSCTCRTLIDNDRIEIGLSNGKAGPFKAVRPMPGRGGGDMCY